MYSLADYKRALTLLAQCHSDSRGEGGADRELEQQLQQFDTIFSGDTV